MALASGKYVTKVDREVVLWPAADANGDGAVVWVEQRDAQGRSIGRIKEKDKHGNEVRSYAAPEGFQNRPGFDHTDNYVKVDERGEVERQPNGEAICIKPGQALVFEPDGSVSVLEDEYAQYLFEQAHDATGDTATVSVSEKETSSVFGDPQTDADPADEVVRLKAELAAAQRNLI